MRSEPLDGSDLVVSAVGLGCNNFGGRLDLERTREVVDAALDAGITFFDTADIYGNRGNSERSSKLLQAATTACWRRFGHDMGDGFNGSGEYAGRALRASLERADGRRPLLLTTADGGTPLAETLRSMRELVAEGLTRAIGCSNLRRAAGGPTSGAGERRAAVRRRAERVQPARARGRGDVLPTAQR
jgi:aryl-alcohol dehydrogenase-like predicted oxidoreductase